MQHHRIATLEDHPDDIIEEARERWRKASAGLEVRREYPESVCFASFLRKQPRLDRLDWLHIPNEVGRPPGGGAARWAAIRGKQNQRMGVLIGASDFLIMRPIYRDGVMWHGLWLEMKRLDGREHHVEPEQRDFIERRKATGWVATWAPGALAAQFITEALYRRRF